MGCDFPHNSPLINSRELRILTLRSCLLEPEIYDPPCTCEFKVCELLAISLMISDNCAANNLFCQNILSDCGLSQIQMCPTVTFMGDGIGIHTLVVIYIFIFVCVLFSLLFHLFFSCLA